MITYVYRCEICGEFESKQHITDEPLKVCPICGAECQRMIPKTPPTIWWVGKPHLKDAGLL